MSEHATTASGEQAGKPPPPPPLRPDPKLISHREGNKFALQRYRRRARQLLEEAQRNSGRSLG